MDYQNSDDQFYQSINESQSNGQLKPGSYQNLQFVQMARPGFQNPQIMGNFRGLQAGARPMIIRPGVRAIGVPQRFISNPRVPLIAPKPTVNEPKTAPVFQNLKVTTIKASPSRGRGRGRGRGAKVSNFKDIPELECDIDPNELPYPKSLPYTPTDKTLPCWNLINEDPFNDFIDAVHPDQFEEMDDEDEIMKISASNNINMKNSELCPEVDIEEIMTRGKNLDGFELFSLVQKKNIEKSKAQVKDEEILDDNTSNMNNRIKELWKFLPETTKSVWKDKAKRYTKLIDQKKKKSDYDSSDKRQKEITKNKNQLEKQKINSCNLVDISAIFKMLEFSYDEMAKATAEYKGPISEDSMLSLLLDGLTSSLIPLLALCNEIDELENSFPKENLLQSLNNLTHVVPILKKLN